MIDYAIAIELDILLLFYKSIHEDGGEGVEFLKHQWTTSISDQEFTR